MKSIWKDIFTAIFMGMVVPGVMLNFGVMLLDAQREASANMPEISASVTEPDVSASSMPMLFRQEDGTTVQMDMEAYLLGVVLAEMPAAFEPEALKAQAVVARTYTQKAYTTGGKHGDGSVCGTASCCQAYIAEESYLDRGGDLESVNKIRQAVLDTSGFVLTYQGELIEATYFSCSGGMTEDAVAVWGTDFPYLRSVGSPGEEDALHYTDTVIIPLEEFRSVLGLTLEENFENWFTNVSYTAGGGVDTMEIGGKRFRGTELRTLLKLRSTAFTMEITEEGVQIDTRGYGHRVGMSQYGAEAMAVNGSLYPEILAYYYHGTKLTHLE